MISIRDLSREQELTETEMLAVVRLAGIPAVKPTDHLTDEQAQLVRDVLDGKVVPKAPRRKVSLPTGKLLLIGFGVVAVTTVLAIVGSALSTPGRVSVVAGDCFDEPPLFGAVLDPVSCSGPHKYRAYASLNLSLKYGAEYPGRDVVESHVRNRCDALYSGDGTFERIYYFYPDDLGWDRGARAAVCATLD